MTTRSETTAGWTLEVVKGKDPGRIYSLGHGEIVLGNALNGATGIELADQEANSPRRMAGMQAQLNPSNGTFTIRDLRSPGGTFVNRERLSPGSDRKLESGDLIQLGSVQLRVSRGGAESSRPSVLPPPDRPFQFTLKGGSVCKSWDDFLTVSAQKWNDLRDELTSGRLAGFLTSVGRTDLLPDPRFQGTPDERLDAWIGGLPTTKPAKPELDVHPRSIVVRTSAAGGSTHRKIQVSNTGYRLLEVHSRVEPAGSGWLRIVGANQAPLVVIDSAELSIEIDLPEAIAPKLAAIIVLKSNGGTEKVEVRVEPSVTSVDPEISVNALGLPSMGLGTWLESQSPRSRLIRLGLGFAGLRVILAIADLWRPTSSLSPGLAGAAAVVGMLGLGAGVSLAVRRGEVRDLPAAGLTGCVLGTMLAAVFVAVGRVIEPFTGGWVLLAIILWGLLGLAIAGISLRIVPFRTTNEGSSR